MYIKFINKKTGRSYTVVDINREKDLEFHEKCWWSDHKKEDYIVERSLF